MTEIHRYRDESLSNDGRLTAFVGGLIYWTQNLKEFEGIAL